MLVLVDAPNSNFVRHNFEQDIQCPFDFVEDIPYLLMVALADVGVVEEVARNAAEVEAAEEAVRTRAEGAGVAARNAVHFLGAALVPSDTYLAALLERIYAVLRELTEEVLEAVHMAEILVAPDKKWAWVCESVWVVWAGLE